MLFPLNMRDDLRDLGVWLSQSLGVDTIESHISILEPLSVMYKWQGPAKGERFLLAIKVTPQALKIFNLWIPRSQRNQGIGSAIVCHLVQLALSHGIESILIEPRPGSEGFWSKLEFAPSVTNKEFWIRSVIRDHRT